MSRQQVIKQTNTRKNRVLKNWAKFENCWQTNNPWWIHNLKVQVQPKGDDHFFFLRTIRQSKLRMHPRATAQLTHIPPKKISLLSTAYQSPLKSHSGNACRAQRHLLIFNGNLQVWGLEEMKPSVVDLNLQNATGGASNATAAEWWCSSLELWNNTNYGADDLAFHISGTAHE